MTELVLGINAGPARRGANEFRRSAASIERSAKGATGRVSRLDGAFQQLKSRAVALTGALAVLAGGVALRGTIRAFSDFEEQLIAVGKTTGIEGENLGLVGDRIQEIAGRVPLATSRLQSLAVAAGQLGVDSVEDVARFTETLGKMEIATDVAGEEGARSLARLLNITGEGVSEVDRLGSSIVQLGNNLATTESEIVRTSTFLGASTQQFGLTAAEVVGLSGALRAMGQRAETSGSAVGAALQEINSAISEGGDNLRTLIGLTNKSGERLRVEFGDSAVNVLTDFAEGLSSLPAAEQARVLDDFGLAGRETSRVINALVADTDNVRNALEMASKEWRDNTALNKEAEVATTAFNAQMQLLGNTVNELAVDMGSEFAPAFTNTAGAIRRGLDDINDGVDELTGQNRLDFWLENLNSGMAFAADAVLGASRVIGTALETMGQAIGATAGAITMLLAGEFRKAWEISKDFGEITFENFEDLISSDLTVFRDALKESREESNKLSESLKDVEGAALGIREAGAFGGGSSSDAKSLKLPEAIETDGRALIGGATNPAGGPMLAAEAYRRLGGEISEANEESEKLNRTTDRLSFTFTSAFEDAIVAGNELSDVLRGLAQDIIRIGLRQAVTQPLGNALASAVAGAFSGTSINSGAPGFRADDGPVTAGDPFIVGERDPELFTPNRSGMILPNKSLGGVNQNVTIDARGADKAAIVRLERALLSLRQDMPRIAVQSVNEAQARS